MTKSRPHLIVNSVVWVACSLRLVRAQAWGAILAYDGSCNVDNGAREVN